jgi:hypothetical protein
MSLWLSLWTSAARAGDPCADTAEVEARSAAIKAIYDEGEAERASRTSTATSVLARDEARVAQVLKHDKKGELCTADDKWYGAWVLTQGDKIPVLERSYELAIEAMEAGHPNGNWLVAYTFDRKRVLGGYLQAYGTQTRVNERNQWCLIEVDPAITDAERAEYGQPVLADTYRRLLDMNGFGSDEPTFERLQRRGLSCPPLAISKKAQKKVRAPE